MVADDSPLSASDDVAGNAELLAQSDHHFFFGEAIRPELAFQPGMMADVKA